MFVLLQMLAAESKDTEERSPKVQNSPAAPEVTSPQRVGMQAEVADDSVQFGDPVSTAATNTEAADASFHTVASAEVPVLSPAPTVPRADSEAFDDEDDFGDFADF